MDRRIFGIENEYGITCTFEGQRRLTPDEVARYLFRKVVSWGRSSNVFLSNGSVHVMDNTCPHAGGNLAGGFVEEGCAVCPWHYWMFKLEDGELRDVPGVNVRTYRTRVFDDQDRKLVQAELPMY